MDTYVIVPESRDYWGFEKRYMVVQGNEEKTQRDEFFYYLFVANIVLLLIVGVLVFGAAKMVYF